MRMLLLQEEGNTTKKRWGKKPTMEVGGGHQTLRFGGAFSQVLIGLSKNLAKYIVVCMVCVEVAPTSTSFMLCFE
jgi:hypothetical protein